MSNLYSQASTPLASRLANIVADYSRTRNTARMAFHLVSAYHPLFTRLVFVRKRFLQSLIVLRCRPPPHTPLPLARTARAIQKTGDMGGMLFHDHPWVGRRDTDPGHKHLLRAVGHQPHRRGASTPSTSTFSPSIMVGDCIGKSGYTHGSFYPASHACGVHLVVLSCRSLC